MEKIDYYVRIPIGNLAVLLGLIESHDCAITSKLIADAEAHVNITGDWNSYEAIANARIAHSLEHFEDDH